MGKPSVPQGNAYQGALQEAEFARDAQRYETYANRPDQSSPFGDVVWERTLWNPNTGRPYDPATDANPTSLPSDTYRQDRINSGFFGGGGYNGGSNLTGYTSGFTQNGWNQLTPDQQQYLREVEGYSLGKNGVWSRKNPNYVSEPVEHHKQIMTLKPEYQAWADSIRDTSMAEAGLKQQMIGNWSSSPDFGIPTVASYGVTNPTLGRDDWREFGTAQQTIGGDDWREFGMPDSTIGADDWRQFGTTAQTIGADDWRQFGTTSPVINPGTFDERFGNTADAYRSEFGDHDMGGGDWNYIDYQPEHIRQQAYDMMYQSDVNRLDPQFESELNDLKITMRNQGLQPGDQQWNSRINSFTKGRNDAYEQARLNAMGASRAEAAMLWDQEMAQSEQKNRYHQADIDNAYRARQANIQNLLSGRQTDMQGYLDYSRAAFDQDMMARQQQLDANLQYGREAWGQDFQERMRQQQANLDYGQAAYMQDYQRAMADRQANLDYGQAAYMQDFQNREAQRQALLNYGNAAFNQDLQSRQQQLDAEAYRQSLINQRYGMLNPEQGVATVINAVNG